MGSPFGPTISEFYMSPNQNKIFKTIITKPKIYVRYVDDIFVATHSHSEINKLKQTLEKNFVLNFITELTLIKKALSLMYLLTPIITSSWHLHILYGDVVNLLFAFQRQFHPT